MHDDAVFFGIAQDDPSITPLENFYSDVSIVVSEDYEITGAREAKLPGGM